jgi:hypothetical protein
MGRGATAAMAGANSCVLAELLQIPGFFLWTELDPTASGPEPMNGQMLSVIPLHEEIR